MDLALKRGPQGLTEETMLHWVITQQAAAQGPGPAETAPPKGEKVPAEPVVEPPAVSGAVTEQ